MQLLERLAQRLVLVRLDRIQAGEHLGLISLKPGSGFAAGFAASVSVSPTFAARSSLIPAVTKPTSPAFSCPSPSIWG